MNMFPTRFRSFTRGALLCAAALVFVSCSDDDTTGPSATEFDATAVLLNTTDNVIVSTYSDLEQQAAALKTAIQAFTAAPSTATLEAARTAWRQTRRPWEMSEGFLFGPVDTKGLDPALDSWPVNTVDLDEVLAGTQQLTKEYIDGLEGTLKGFHTIEYLLFGTDGNKQGDNFTQRQFDYLNALAASLHGTAEELHHSWTTAGDNFGANLRDAGKSTSIYPSQKAALEELVQGILAIADEVGNGKINDPFSQSDITLEESRFSSNSKADFQDNIRSILHIYTGDYKQSGVGLDDYVSRKNAALDTRIKSEINAAITAIGAIPGTFTTAISQERAAVAAAQEAVRTLQQTIETELVPLFSAM